MKKQMGVTLMALVITVMVMGILAGVTVNVGYDIIKQAKLQNLNTNMLLLQAKIKTISEEASFNNNTSNYKGQKVSEVTSNEKVTILKDNGVIDVSENYYLLSQNDLNSIGLEKIQIEDGYIVNYETEEIIYVKGFELNGAKYYKLSETKDLKMD